MLQGGGEAVVSFFNDELANCGQQQPFASGGFAQSLDAILHGNKGKGMKHILLFAGLMLATMQSEGGVFKCQTPNGFVYSEQPCAHDAKTLEYRSPPPRVPVDANRAENGGTEAMANDGTLQTCLTLARAMVDKKDMNPARIRADSKQLLDLCPSTAYECVTYTQRPEANNCKAVPMQPGGSIVSNNTYAR